jgi:hypothetical protein
MLGYRFDTQLLIEWKNLSEDKINEYISKNIEGDCLLAISDEKLNPILRNKVMPYCRFFDQRTWRSEVRYQKSAQTL